MSGRKWDRTPSKRKFVNNAFKLRKNIIDLLLRDLRIKDINRDIKWVKDHSKKE